MPPVITPRSAAGFVAALAIAFELPGAAQNLPRPSPSVWTSTPHTGVAMVSERPRNSFLAGPAASAPPVASPQPAVVMRASVPMPQPAPVTVAVAPARAAVAVAPTPVAVVPAPVPVVAQRAVPGPASFGAPQYNLTGPRLTAATVAVPAPVPVAATAGGTYGITSATTVNITSPLQITEQRHNAAQLIVIPSAGADVALDLRSANGDRCMLRATRAPDGTMALVPGQRCTITDDVRNMTFQITLLRGQAAVANNAVSLRATWRIAGSFLFAQIGGTAEQVCSGPRL